MKKRIGLFAWFRSQRKQHGHSQKIPIASGLSSLNCNLSVRDSLSHCSNQVSLRQPWHLPKLPILFAWFQSLIATESERRFFKSRFSLALLKSLTDFWPKSVSVAKKPNHANPPNVFIDASMRLPMWNLKLDMVVSIPGHYLKSTKLSLFSCDDNYRQFPKLGL